MSAEQDSVTAPPNHGRFKLIRKPFHKHYEWTLDDGESKSKQELSPMYFVSTSVVKRGRPHLLLHTGPYKDPTSTLACAWIIVTSRSSKIGLGDHLNSPDEIIWEDFRHNFKLTEFTWGVDLPTGRVDLIWKRTQHHAVDGKTTGGLDRHWKLVSVNDKDHIIALFSREKGLNSVVGILQVHEDWGTAFEQMLLITVVTLVRQKDM